MDKLKVLEQTQRLRDVAQQVVVCGKADTYQQDSAIIAVICEMQVVGDEWIKILDERIKHLKKELKPL